jgi:putative oxidoreductase
LHAINWETAAVLYARIALGTAFLSAVAGRFGLWQGTFDWGSFAKFQQYAVQVNSFVLGGDSPDCVDSDRRGNKHWASC